MLGFVIPTGNGVLSMYKGSSYAVKDAEHCGLDLWQGKAGVQ